MPAALACRVEGQYSNLHPILDGINLDCLPVVLELPHAEKPTPTNRRVSEDGGGYHELSE